MRFRVSFSISYVTIRFNYVNIVHFVVNKKSDFSIDLWAKNRFSGGMETILTK